jgi:PAS domain S-box-containing protein
MAAGLDELFRSIHADLRSIMDATNFYIALYDQTKDTVIFPYWVDTIDDCHPPIIGVNQSASLIAAVIRSGFPLMVTKQEISSLYAQDGLASPAGTPSEIWLGVPLKAGNEMIGVMAIQSYHDPTCYDQTDLEVMVAVANLTATAVRRIRAELGLKESESRFREVLENSLDVSYRRNLKTNSFDYFSSVSALIFGYSVDDLMILPLEKVLRLIHPDDLPSVEHAIEESMANPPGIIYQTEYRIQHKDGQYIWVLDQFKLVRDETGQPVAVIGSIRDISENTRAKEKLLLNENIIRHSSSAIAACDLNGNMMYGNPNFSKLWGFENSEEFLGRPFTEFWLLGDGYEKVMNTLRTEGTWTGQIKAARKNGTHFDVQVSAAMIFDNNGKPAALTSSSIDITANKQAEDALLAALNEKNMLLREVHHRVKNNMQIIISLLVLQSQKLTDEQAKQALSESRQRIFAIAMIHEALYRDQIYSAIDLGIYVKNLVSHLRMAYTGQKEMDVVLDMDDIKIDIDQAVPCGLIINELMTNALNHAFPDGTKGTIRIEAHRINFNEVLLNVSDDGVGLPSDLNLEDRSSLGLRLVKELVCRQLKGSLNTAVTKGTSFIIRWPLSINTDSEFNAHTVSPGIKESQ